VLSYSSLVRLLWLKTTGVSITLTKRTLDVLVIINSYHFSLANGFEHFLHPFCWAVVSKLIPTLKLISVCKIALIVGKILTWELRKWSHLSSCCSNQENDSMTILWFLMNLSSIVNLETRFLKGGRVVTPRCYCSSYSTSTVSSTVFIQWWLQYNPNSMKMVFSTDGVGSFWVKLKVWIYKLLCIWTIKLSLEFFRIIWSRMRPHSQQRKCCP
jgi:hypothetical protein